MNSSFITKFPDHMRAFAHPGISSFVPTQKALLDLFKKVSAYEGKKISADQVKAIPQHLRESAFQLLSQNKTVSYPQIILHSSIIFYEEDNREYHVNLDEFYRYNEALDQVEKSYIHAPIQELNSDSFHKMLYDIHSNLLTQEKSAEAGMYRTCTMIINKTLELSDADPEVRRKYLESEGPQAVSLFNQSARLINDPRYYEKWKKNKLPRGIQKFVTKHFVVCPPAKEVHEKMTALFEQIKKRLQSGENPIAVAAYAHLELTRIHPFADGNGRMSRILMNMILMQAGHQPIPMLSHKHYNLAIREDERENNGAFERYIRFLVERSDYEEAPLDPNLINLYNIQHLWDNISPAIKNSFLR